MKKHLLMLCLLLLGGFQFSNAQTTFSLLRNGETLTDGAKIVVTTYTLEYDWSEYGMGVGVSFDSGIHIKNVSGGGVSFPDFSRRFFVSLTKRLDAFAKSSLKRFTRLVFLP